MSYIPKYILKRMVPMDAVKATDNGFVIEVTNVISPLSVDEIPDDLSNLISFKVDGKELPVEKFKLKHEDTVVDIMNPQSALGVTVPVGGKIEIIYEGGKLEPGTHEFEVNIQADSPVSIKLERELK
ncbi:MAG: hypothetical protein ACTSU5_12880 [Promethearchaeota archaeon]